MTDLSPSAQAVLDAFLKTPGEVPMPGWNYGRDLAAALRAAAQQVAPSDADEPRNNLPMALECQRIRAEILAIADELDGR
jgi:hypothetical protein